MKRLTGATPLLAFLLLSLVLVAAAPYLGFGVGHDGYGECLLRADTAYPPLCYDSLATSGLWIVLLSVSIMALFRVQRQLEAHKRAQAILLATQRVMEQLARQEPLTDVVTSIITLLEGERSGLHVSLMVAGQHIASSSPLLLDALIRHFESGVETKNLERYLAHHPVPRLSPNLLAQARRKSVFVSQTDCDRCRQQMISGPDAWMAQDHCNACTADFLEAAKVIGITAVRAEPVFDEDGVLLGLVNFYYGFNQQPSPADEAIMVKAMDMLTIVARHHRHASQLHLMQALVENNSDPMYLCSPEEGFRLCYANEALVRFFGYDREKVLSLRVPDYDPNFPGHKLNEVWQHLKATGCHRVETINRVAGGREVWVDVTGFYLEHEGREYIAGSFRDISQRKQAEQDACIAADLAQTRLQHQHQAESRSRLLEGIIEHSGTPSYLIDPHDNYRLVYANQAAAQHFGYPEHSLTQLSISTLNPELQPDQLRVLWESLLANHSLTFQTTHNTATDQSVPVEVGCHYLHHEGREYIAVYCTNISLRRQQEAELRQAWQTAQTALAVRNRFMAQMSHELRTPLNGILGLSRLALESNSRILMRDYLDRIHFSGENLLSVIEDILDFSSLESGGLMLNQAVFSVRAVWQEVLDTAGPLALAKKIVLSGEIDRKVPEYLQGDARRLRQIVLNLVDNAIKFTDQGTVTVRIDSRQEDGRIWVRWTVTDSGIGIRTEDRNRLFEPFVQLDQSNNRRYGGSGLGLAISLRLVKMMGGYGIQVEGAPGVGSTFSTELPFKWADLAETPDVRSGGDSPHPLAGLHVLIVEDNHINQTVARAVVEKLGATVTLADDGSQALLQLASQPPDTYDVVLMDIQMPVMDGYTATRRIRQEPELVLIPVIAVSAHAMNDDRTASLEAGMNAHLTKPLRRDELLKTVLTHLQAHSHQRLRNATNRSTETHQVGDKPGDNLFDLSILNEADETLQAMLRNLPNAISRMGGNELLYRNMARMFIQEHARDARTIREFIRDQNDADALRTTRILKGLAATLGLDPLTSAAGALETGLQGSWMADLPPVLLTAFENRLADAIEALKRLIRHPV